MMNAEKLVERIILEQELVIGPLAWQEAEQVRGLAIKEFNKKYSLIGVRGETRVILRDLVKRYERLFGRASVEVCRDAVRNLLPHFSASDIPEELQ